MKDKKQVLLDELSKESELVIATAHLYAKTFVRYGGDITEAWTTATQQTAILEKAYNKGYSDARKEREKRKVGKWIPIWDSDHLVVLAYQCSECGIMRNQKTNYCADCGTEMRDAEND